MLTASGTYREALPRPHQRATTVEVFHQGVREAVFRDGLIVDGSVTARLTSQVTRSLNMTIDPSYYPGSPGDLFAPESAVVKVSTGIRYMDGSREVFPVFTGRPYDVQLEADGGVTLTGDDLAADVIGFPFEQPVASRAGAPIIDEVQRLILQAVPDALFGDSDTTSGTTPTLVWDDSRGKALDDLAAAVQGRWYTLGDGRFVVRRYPYSGGVPVLSLVDQSGGVNITARISRTRRGVANSVTIVSERMDGTAPIRFTARDLDPASPIQFDGPYGRVAQIIKVQTPINTATAQTLAVAQLASNRALAEQWQISCVSDASLEPGDTIGVEYRKHASVQVIDSITYPLALGSMTLQTRSSVAA